MALWVATFQLLLPVQPFMKWLSTISSVVQRPLAVAIWFISKATLHLVFIPELSLKADSTNNTLKTSAENLNQAAVYLPTHILGLCLISGNSRLFQWALAPLCRFIKPSLIAIFKIVKLFHLPTAKSGAF